MAEIPTNAAVAGNRKGIAHPQKKSTRVDLTPMVDLGFLLITFFIFTTTMQESTAMRFYLPADGPRTLAGESSSLTLVPTGNNRILYYHGSLEAARINQKYGITHYHMSDGIGEIIRSKQKSLDQQGKKKELTVLVYPDITCTYKNIVDLMDEMLINAVGKYSISEDPHAVAQLQELVTASGKDRIPR